VKELANAIAGKQSVADTVKNIQAFAEKSLNG
jgi:hypothetical protein